MKTIENISPVFEEIIRKGMETALSYTGISIFQSQVDFFYKENTIFILFKNFNNYSKKQEVILFEVKSNESSFLLTSINQIILALDIFGEEEKKKNTKALYNKVISFCKENNFDCSDIEALDAIC